jgi:tetratricopeptide (TPR) repeat protein
MGRVFQIVATGALLAAALPAALTAQDRGTPTSQTRSMTAVDEMGRSGLGPTGFEEADDPTIAKHPVTPHEPLRAARKAAEKAEHLAKKKQHDEAIAGYREAVALDPLYFEAWNNLALELQAAGKSDEAEQVFRRLMQSNPEHVLVFTNLATLLSGQKRYADAETVARAAMKLHGYSFKANLVLGTVLVSEGRWSDEAKTKLEYAQVKYPEAKTLLKTWPEGAAH